MSRLLIVIVSGIYIAIILPKSILVVLFCILICFVLIYRMLNKFLIKNDNRLTKSIKAIEEISKKYDSNYEFMYYIKNQFRLGELFERRYNQYANSRGLNALGSLLPRYVLELFVVSLFILSTLNFLDFGDEMMKNFAEILVLGYRINPHVQILVKNFATMNSSISISDKFLGDNFEKINEKYSSANIKLKHIKSKVIILTGDSGAGKTTMVRHYANYISRKKIRIAFIPVNADIPLTSESMEFIKNTEFKKYLNYLKIDEEKLFLNHALSNGERQRVLLAIALQQEVDIIILDETLSALDEINNRLLLEILSKNQKVKKIIFIGHNMPSDIICEYFEDVDEIEVRRE